MEAQGLGAKVTVKENSVIVDSSSFGAKGSTKIPFEKITKIQWGAAHIFARGSLRFFSDSNRTHDVIFTRSQQPQMEAVKDHVLAKANELSGGVTFEDKSISPVGYGVVLAIVVAVMAFFIAPLFLGNNSSEFTKYDAHALCDNAIKSASLNRDLVKIPYREARETDAVYGFIWRREDGLKMPNAFGAQVDTVVICRVNKQTKRVDHLEVNGETLSPR